MELTVSRLSSLDQFRRCEELQARVWGPDDVVRVPALVMVTAQINGGCAFGAFAGDELVGFVLASPGLTADGRVKQGSILMAVDPGHQNNGVGFRLKVAQREAALAQGIDLITWTFDPLASANAYLNVHKLGCVSSRYFVDLYGTPENGLNAGMPTDRLLAEWWIREPSVAGRLAQPADAAAAFSDRSPGPLVNEVAPDPQTGLPRLRRVDLDRTEPALLVEVPENIRAVKLADIELARAWRREIRAIFQGYFSRGYRVAGFRRLPGEGGIRPCFLLEHVL